MRLIWLLLTAAPRKGLNVGLYLVRVWVVPVVCGGWLVFVAGASFGALCGLFMRGFSWTYALTTEWLW